MGRSIGKKCELEAGQKPGGYPGFCNSALIRFQVGIAGQSGFIDFQQLARFFQRQTLGA